MSINKHRFQQHSTFHAIHGLNLLLFLFQELLKLRKKITTTVQVLTHLKEKLQFVQAENSEQRSGLRHVEAHVAQVCFLSVA